MFPYAEKVSLPSVCAGRDESVKKLILMKKSSILLIEDNKDTDCSTGICIIPDEDICLDKNSIPLLSTFSLTCINDLKSLPPPKKIKKGKNATIDNINSVL